MSRMGMPMRCESSLRRRHSSLSLAGTNLLKKGAMKLGYESDRTTDTMVRKAATSAGGGGTLRRVKETADGTGGETVKGKRGKKREEGRRIFSQWRVPPKCSMNRATEMRGTPMVTENRNILTWSMNHFQTLRVCRCCLLFGVRAKKTGGDRDKEKKRP